MVMIVVMMRIRELAYRQCQQVNDANVTDP